MQNLLQTKQSIISYIKMAFNETKILSGKAIIFQNDFEFGDLDV
tara:strand:- start:405 stop:536 length:132 start_codon:yes stop_codon:yes gene_type:complete